MDKNKGIRLMGLLRKLRAFIGQKNEALASNIAQCVTDFVDQANETSPIDIQQYRESKKPIVASFLETHTSHTQANPLTFLAVEAAKRSEGYWRHHAGETFSYLMITTAQRIPMRDKTRWTDFLAELDMQIHSNYFSKRTRHSNPAFINAITSNIDLLLPNRKASGENANFRRQTIAAFKQRLIQRLERSNHHSYREAIQNLTGVATSTEYIAPKKPRKKFKWNDRIKPGANALLFLGRTVSFSASPYLGVAACLLTSSDVPLFSKVPSAGFSFLIGIILSKYGSRFVNRFKPKSKMIELKACTAAVALLSLSIMDGVAFGILAQMDAKNSRDDQAKTRAQESSENRLRSALQASSLESVNLSDLDKDRMMLVIKENRTGQSPQGRPIEFVITSLDKLPPQGFVLQNPDIITVGNSIFRAPDTVGYIGELSVVADGKGYTYSEIKPIPLPANIEQNFVNAGLKVKKSTSEPAIAGK